MDSAKKSVVKKIHRQTVLHDDLRERNDDPLEVKAKELDIPQFIINLLQRSADYFYLVDADASFLIVNDAACQSLGYSMADLLKMKMTDIDVIHDVAGWSKLFKKVRADGSARIETLQRNKDGYTFPVDTTINYMLHNGKEYCLIVGRELTERKKVEGALKESESKYRRLVESAGAGMATINLGGYINFANNTLCQMLGYSREELIDKLFVDFLHKEDADQIIKLFSGAVNGSGPRATLDFRAIHKSGRIVWCNTSPTDIVYEDKVIGFSVIIHDITERKYLEEALKESEKKYRAIVEDQLELICRFIPDGTITFANGAFCKFYGKSSREIVGRSYLSMIDEHQYPVFTASIEELLTEPDRVIYDIQPLVKGNSTRWMEQTLRALSNEKGQVEKFQVVLRDITDRKKAEQALKESEEQYRIIFDSMHDGFAVFEVTYGENGAAVEARFLEVNPAFEKITGVKANDIIGKTMWEVFPTMRLLTAEIWESIVSEGKTMHLEEFYSATLDKYFRVNGLSPKRGRYAVLFSDLTEHKKMTEKLVRADRLSSLGEMAAGLAHEINNPLTGVIGLSQLLLEKQDIPESVKEDAGTICREANRAASILSEFLIFARGQKPHKQAADLNTIIESVIKLRRTYMKKSGIDVTTNFVDDLPELMLDVSQMQQVCLNIVLNAEYFMYEANKRGLLQVSTERIQDTVKIVFQDDGPGILPANLTHIFDPFFTTKEVGKGTGLGLSISYGIIREHNGNIFAESKPGQGTSFIIELPITTA
ncbi:MAG: PAS domain S-box protein [Dehalococcoidia bacterium]